ncbi:MAG TPA: lipase family protein, partial [Candidatus Acidoferrum sp.]|nr:lipase family protein [Candidatus Acidoferrum sp.]
MSDTNTNIDCRLLCASTCAYDIASAGTFTPNPPHYPAVGWTAPPAVYFAGPDNIDACLIGANESDGLILAFRGTLPPITLDVPPQLLDWAQDIFLARPVAQPGILPADMMVHEGFANAVDSLWPQIVPALRDLQVANPESKLYITGHSKGGAMAPIAAARLFFQEGIGAAGVYTYAPARAGNSAFVAGFPDAVPVLRYEYHNDIVPLLPPDPSFIEIAHRLPLLGELLEVAADWDYASLGTLRYFREDGSITGDSPFLPAIRAAEIVAKMVAGDFGDIAKDHAPWCRGPLSNGG